MATRRASVVAPDLSPNTVAVLLHGWGATAPVPSPHEFSHGFLDLYERDGPCGREVGMIRMWRAHETWLRDTASRWGWQPTVKGPDGMQRFYAEHQAAGFPV